MASDKKKENNSKKKSFIGKLIDELEINKSDLADFEDAKKKKTNPNIVEYDWDKDSPLSGRRVLITKKGELLRKNYENISPEDEKDKDVENIASEETDLKKEAEVESLKEEVNEEVVKTYTENPKEEAEAETITGEVKEDTVKAETEEASKVVSEETEDIREDIKTEEVKEEMTETTTESEVKETSDEVEAKSEELKETEEEVFEDTLDSKVETEEVKETETVKEKVKDKKVRKNKFLIYWAKLRELLAEDKNSKYRQIGQDQGPSKKLLFILVSILCVTALSLIGIIALEGESFAIDSISTDFVKLLDEGNIDKLKSSIEFEGDDTKAFENSIPNFVQLYKEDDEFKEYVKESIAADVKSIKEDEDFKTESLIGVVKSGKNNFIFTGYRVKISPLTINSESIVNKTIKVGDDSHDIKSEVSVIPGVYDIISEYEFLKLSNSASLKYENDEAISNINVDYSKAEIANESFELKEGDYEFRIRSADDNGVVFVDGKNTNTTVENFNDMDGINLSDENSIAVVEASPKGFGLSETVSLAEESGSARFNVSYENNLMLDNFIGLIRTTFRNDTEAFRNSDINMLTTLGGEELDAAMGWINRNIGKNQYYVREYMSFLIDLDAFEVKSGSFFSSASAYVGGFLNYKEGRFSNDEENPSTDDLDEYVDKKTGFHFKFDEEEGKWYVDLWGTTYRNIGTDNALLLKLD